jgi:hypothetical protein
MALALIDHFKPVGMLNGAPFPVLSGVAESATTWYKGAVLIDSGSGYLTEGADGPTTGTIVGVALSAKVAGELTKPIVPALPGVIFSGRIATGDSGGDYTSLVTNRYSKFGIALDSSGAWYINVADTTDYAVLVLNFIDAIGTNLAKVQFTFIDSVFGALT